MAKLICDLDAYEPWAGARSAWGALDDACLIDALDSFLEEAYPDGIEMTALNDILWFDFEYLLSCLTDDPDRIREVMTSLGYDEEQIREAFPDVDWGDEEENEEGGLDD